MRIPHTVGVTQLIARNVFDVSYATMDIYVGPQMLKTFHILTRSQNYMY